MFSESWCMDKMVALKIIEIVLLLIILYFKFCISLETSCYLMLFFFFFPSLKRLFTLVIYLLELWEFRGFVPTKQHSTVTVLSKTCRGPRANQNVFKCMTCVKLMKIHDFSLSGLLELKSSEKGECKEFYLILLILKSFLSPYLGPVFQLHAI